MSEEVWKDVVGFEGMYKISSHGRVLTLERTYFNGRYKTNRVVKQGIKGTSNRKGYINVGLRKDNKNYNFSVHRLVAIMFIPNPEDKKEVNHINGIKDDNRVENLEWMTPSENVRHAHAMGLADVPRLKGEQHGCSKLTDEKVRVIKKLLLDGLSQYKIAAMFGVSRSAILHIKVRGGWSHIII